MSFGVGDFITEEKVAAVLERAPELRPFLLRLASRALKGQSMPRSFTAGVLGYAAQEELNHLLGTVTARTTDGKVYGDMLPFLVGPGVWLPAARALGLGKKEAEETPAAMFARLEWKHPDRKAVLRMLVQETEVARFLKRGERCRQWSRLFEAALPLLAARDMDGRTLSQLGSSIFNDSKVLRVGALRRQLCLILAGLLGRSPDDERKVFECVGIVDNPYTSFVTVFAPFAYTDREGSVFDFPARLFAAGLACQLPLETVGRMVSVEWRGEAKEVATSENAAPLVVFVERRIPCVYTEGYPNSAVQRLLGFFADCGVTAHHYGDADLDGLLIARAVGEKISVTKTEALRVIDAPGTLKGIPLTPEQRGRIERFLDGQPISKDATALRRLLDLGCWYEQEAFPI